ncbi:hypothetical protein K0018_08610 [Staphylococcus massiliensis]|uniref:hypothetical protein n=1 Tax=Staphylococcus massiliensis TaxID=555791 RepID=UPI001EDE8370|nr:hypothetical protein [Staphylococcus massiliensis]MCG3413121.1 hypothetical protein [Staphylococcus massiliensis]
MYEKDFHLLEGETISLPELGKKIESITGYQVKESTGEIKRVVAHLPNFDSETDTFVATYRLNHNRDLVDATFTANKSDRNRLKEIPVQIELISYVSRA